MPVSPTTKAKFFSSFYLRSCLFIFSIIYERGRNYTQMFIA
jgi:hypothetical protein